MDTVEHGEEKKEETGGAPPEAGSCDEQLAACARERDEYLNGWRRAKADLINYKKEEAARAEEVIKFGSITLVRELLGIVDSFDIALKSGAASGAEKNLAPILSQFEAMLKRHGAEPLRAVGETFNPAFHEAVSEVASEKPEGVILEEAARGWKLYDKVIRPAKVIISKGQKV